MELYLIIYGVLLAVVGIYALQVAITSRRLYKRICPGKLEKDGPLISIIIPARNEEKNIGRLLDSLIVQSYRNIEILVADDQSTDATGRIIDEYAAKDPRIRKFTTDPAKRIIKNGKISALILLMEHARGEYVLATDADTEHGADSVAYGYTVLKNNNLDLISGKPKEIYKGYMNGVITSAMMFTDIFIPSAFLYHKPIAKATFAIGQYMFMKRSSYIKTGGYSLNKGEICDDVGLARLFISNGLRYASVPISDYMSCYMYDNGKAAFRGIERSLAGVFPPTFSMLAILVLAVFALCHVAFAPAVSIALYASGCFTASATLLLVGYILFAFSWYQACRKSGWNRAISASSSLTLIMICIMYFHGFYKSITGKGFEWKDRVVKSK